VTTQTPEQTREPRRPEEPDQAQRGDQEDQHEGERPGQAPADVTADAVKVAVETAQRLGDRLGRFALDPVRFAEVWPRELVNLWFATAEETLTASRRLANTFYSAVEPSRR
jgi:hypothetical protein